MPGNTSSSVNIGWCSHPQNGGSSVTPEDVEASLRKVGNAFQNVARVGEMLSNILAVSMLPAAPWVELGASFDKRHPITHNLGAADRKYLERAQSTECEGGEIRITASEVAITLDHVQAAVSAVDGQLFRAARGAKPDLRQPCCI